jgi:thiamine kinase-like enzyme
MSNSAEAQVRALPCWKGTPALKPLHGGVSNQSFAVTDKAGRWVARVGRDYPFHHVFRERELMASRAAHAAELSPEVLHGGNGALVLRFIEGVTFGEAEVRANMEACVALVRRCHQVMPRHVTGPASIFWVFHVLRDYCHAIEAAGHPYAGRSEQWRDYIDTLEAAQAPLPIVFGHHDLLPTNFIEGEGRLWLIDWEYGAFGTAMFDLANLAANNSFGPEEETRLLALYFGAPSREIAGSFAAMKVASALREALWGLVSEINLTTPGIDYRQYADGQFERFDRVLHGWQKGLGA